MTSQLLHEQAKAFARSVPTIRPGFTVRVHERIQEGNKERIQVFEGLVISVHRGHTAADSTFTVRRIASGIGVEKVFSLYSPRIEKIEVKKVAKVRRAKLFFLRGLTGKKARLVERFTEAGEFAPVPVPDSASQATQNDATQDSTDTEATEDKATQDATAPTEEVVESTEENKKEGVKADATEETKTEPEDKEKN